MAVLALALAAVVVAPRPWPAPPASPERPLRIDRADGGTLAAAVHGDPDDGPVVVAVHGGPGVPLTAAEERAVAGLATGRRVVVYDQAGVGRSSPPAQVQGYLLESAVRDLGAVVDRFGTAPVTLLGYSWGATVSLAYAARRPDRVRALLLVSPGEVPWRGRTPPRHGPQDRLAAPARATAYALALDPRNTFLYAVAALRPESVPWFAGDDELEDRFAALYTASAGGLSCDGARQPVPWGLDFLAAQVPQLHPDRSGVTREDLRALARTPTLVLRGECDYIPAAAAREYAEVLPRARLVTVPGEGHALLDADSPRVRTEMRRFLDSVAP